MKRLITLVLATVSQITLYAHPGHGIGDEPVFHYVASWWHAFPLVLAMLAVYLLVRRRRRIKA